MAIDRLSAIESVLQQMRAVSHLAQGSVGATVATTAPEGGFAAALQHSLRQVAQTQNTATTQAKAFVAGAPDIALNDVMLDLQKANIAFQTTVQVRNRLVAAYQEVANMAV